jgi:hypothetical protein
VIRKTVAPRFRQVHRYTRPMLHKGAQILFCT